MIAVNIKRALGLATLTGCLALALGVGVAHAASYGVGVVGSFGESTNTSGEQVGSFAYGVGVDQSTHNVYLAKKFSKGGGGGYAYEFPPPSGGEPVTLGEPLAQFGGSCKEASCPALGEGFFKSKEGGLAIDAATSPSTLFIDDGGDKLIQRFTLNSTADATNPPVFDSQFAIPGNHEVGIAVDSKGIVYVPTYTGTGGVKEYTSTGAPGPVPVIEGSETLGQRGTTGTAVNELYYPTDVAVDTNGNVYVVTYENGGSYKTVVEEFNSKGEFVKVLDNEGSDAVGVDPSNNDVWVVDGPSSSEYVNVYDAAGNRIATSTAANLNHRLYNVYQIAVDGASHKAFVGSYNYGEGLILALHPIPEGATTGTATNVTASGATLSGEVQPGGTPIEAYFAYNTGSQCKGGGTTEHVSAGEGTGSVPETATVTGLEPNMTYAFCMVAANKYGEVDGAPVQFTTEAIKPTVSTVVASEVEQTAATLNATVNANNQDTHYYFQYGTTTSYGSTEPAPPGADIGFAYKTQSESVTITGLAKNTTYHFRVLAENATGTSYGADRTFITLPEAPAVGTGEASGVTVGAATLNGTVNAQGDPTTYRFEYGTTTAYGSEVRGVAGSSTSPVPVALEVSGLQPASTYHFRVVATNRDTTTYGADQTFATPAVPPLASTGAAEFVNDTGALLNGTLNPENSETTYVFEYGTTTAYGATLPLTPVEGGAGGGVKAVTASLSGLQPGTTYHYRLQARNAAGTSYGQDMTLTTTGVKQAAAFSGFSIATVPLLSIPPIGFSVKPGEGEAEKGKRHHRKSCDARFKHLKNKKTRHRKIALCKGDRRKGKASRQYRHYKHRHRARRR